MECSVDSPVINNVEVGKPATAQVLCKSMNPVLIESKLTSLFQGTVIEAKVQQKQIENDVYQVEYVPNIRGCHKLKITASTRKSLPCVCENPSHPVW